MPKRRLDSGPTDEELLLSIQTKIEPFFQTAEYVRLVNGFAELFNDIDTKGIYDNEERKREYMERQKVLSKDVVFSLIGFINVVMKEESDYNKSNALVAAVSAFIESDKFMREVSKNGMWIPDDPSVGENFGREDGVLIGHDVYAEVANCISNIANDNIMKREVKKGRSSVPDRVVGEISHRANGASIINMDDDPNFYYIMGAHGQRLRVRKRWKIR